ncbi:hypothetical protein ACWGH4_00150 [Streptomyces sp. NPDC054847]
MGSINLAWIIPACIVAGMLLAAIEWGQRELRSAVRDVYPDSPEHRQALATVDERTAPCCTTWQDLTTAEQAAWDEEALDRAAAAVPPLPDVDGRDTR